MDLEASWPSARAQVGAVLRARGLQAADVDDVAQEVAVRMLRNSRRFDSEEHFVAWCCRVAINLHIDATRRERFLCPPPPGDVAGTQDTAATAQHRMALEALADGIAELSDEERRVLFDAERADSRREAVRLAVRRHRLRARLASLVEGMVAAVLLPRRFIRSLSRTAKASMVAAPALAVGLALAPLTTGGHPPAPATVGAPQPQPITVRPHSAAVTIGSTSELARPRSSTPQAPAPVSRAAPPVPPRHIVVADPAGIPVRVTREQRPTGPLVCTGGFVVNPCIERPPILPQQLLPSRP